MLSLSHIYVNLRSTLLPASFLVTFLSTDLVRYTHFYFDPFSSKTSHIHEFRLQQYFCISKLCIRFEQNVQIFNLIAHHLMVKIWCCYFQFCAKSNFPLPKHWHMFGESAVFYVSNTTFPGFWFILGKVWKTVFISEKILLILLITYAMIIY